MAQSPGHRFGQIIGDVLEAGIHPLLADFAAATPYWNYDAHGGAHRWHKSLWCVRKDNFGNRLGPHQTCPEAEGFTLPLAAGAEAC